MFTFRYRSSGGAPTVQNLVIRNAGTITKGDFVAIEFGGYAVPAATNGTALVGAALDTVISTAGSTDKLAVVTDWDAVYGTTDATARAIGATLDLDSTAAAMTVTTSSNKDFIVVADSTATEETLVSINRHSHWLAGTAVS